MSRIRTIKPEFFRHEELQDLGAIAMLFFAGLWTVSDRNGVFPWKPRSLKLDIVPFLDYDAEEVLAALEAGGFIIRFNECEKEYGFIPSWSEHQRITGKEAESESKYPSPPRDFASGNARETLGKQPGNTRETPGCPGKGKDIGKGKEDIHTPRVREAETEPPEPDTGTDYPKALFDAWATLGGKAIQPPNPIHFLTGVMPRVAASLRGVHSRDVLQAIANFRTIATAPPGKFFWDQRITFEAFIARHLEKFLPANFREDDFLKRETAAPKHETPTRPTLIETYEPIPEENKRPPTEDELAAVGRSIATAAGPLGDRMKAISRSLVPAAG